MKYAYARTSADDQTTARQLAEQRKISRHGNLKRGASPMVEISSETEARINDEARRQGVSVDALLERLMSERTAAARVAGSGAVPQLPRLHLGVMGPLHRRDIYDDVR